MRTILVILFALSSVHALAAKPSSEEIQKVNQYYATGADPILVEKKTCTTVAEDGDNKNNCEDEAYTLVKGKDYLLWMNWFVPAGKKNTKLLVQFNQGGITRRTAQFSVSSSMRYRVWRTFRPSKSGTWEIKILDDSGEHVKEVSSFNLKVE